MNPWQLWLNNSDPVCSRPNAAAPCAQDPIDRNDKQLVIALSQQTNISIHLIDNGRVLQMTQIEHSHRAISTHRGKHIPATAST